MDLYIIFSLYLAPLFNIILNKTPDGDYIIENYDACAGVLSGCYIQNG